MIKKPLLWIVPILGSALLLYMSLPYQAGLAPDSMVYLSTAHHIADGRGVYAYWPLFYDHSTPQIAWPPVYPLILAAPILAGLDPVTFGWALNIVLFAVNLYLAAYLIRRYTQSDGLALLVSAVFALSALDRGFYLWLLTEPLFLCMIHLSLLSLWKYAEEGRLRFLLAGAVVTAVIPLIRYVGVAYIAAGGLVVLFLAQGSPWKRIRDGIVFGLAASMPTALWLFRNIRVQDAVGSSSAQMFGSLIKNHDQRNTVLEQIGYTGRAAMEWARDLWNLGEANDAAVIVMSGLALALIVWMSWYFRRTGEKIIFPAMLAVYTAVYVVTLNASLLYSSFYGQLPARYLFSARAQLILLAVAALGMGGAFMKSVGFPAFLQTALRSVIAVGALGWILFGAMQIPAQVTPVRTLGPDETKGARAERARKDSWFPEYETWMHKAQRDHYRRSRGKF